MLQPEVRFETAKLSIGWPYDPSSTEQPQDPRNAVDRAEHHVIRPFFRKVCDCFHAAAKEIEIGDGMVVQHNTANVSRCPLGERLTWIVDQRC